ncbi:MAG: peptidoglycan-binding domain-containing protein [Terriglobales bacterium]
MFRWLLSAALFLSVASFVVAQDTSSSSTNNPGTTTTNTQKPAGTKVVGHDRDTIVTPKTKPVKIDASVVKSAQTELQSRGYNPGPVDGVAGPKTRAAVAKFQADQGLKQTGHLDTDTLAKLNVGGTNIVSSAPADLGRGGKAAGHDIKEGHPVAAGKAVAQGSESFGKKVAKGSKALAVRGVEKVGKGLSSIGNKVEDKAQGNDNHNQTENAQGQSNPPQQ